MLILICQICSNSKLKNRNYSLYSSVGIVLSLLIMLEKSGLILTVSKEYNPPKSISLSIQLLRQLSSYLRLIILFIYTKKRKILCTYILDMLRHRILFKILTRNMIFGFFKFANFILKDDAIHIRCFICKTDNSSMLNLINISRDGYDLDYDSKSYCLNYCNVQLCIIIRFQNKQKNFTLQS